MPVSIPVIIAIVLAPFVIPTGALTSTGILNTGHILDPKLAQPAAVAATHNANVVEPESYGVVQPISAQDLTEDLSAESAREPTIAELEALAETQDDGLDGELEGAETETEVDSEGVMADGGAQSDTVEEKLIGAVEAVEASKMSLQGGKWDEQLHNAIRPECHDVETKPYRGQVKTGFVSYPRSGNSYMRSLVERATGYQTSSVCEPSRFSLFSWLEN